MNIGEMQRKLSEWATQDKEHRFFDLYHLLYDRDWLRLAHDYVKQNAGSITAGCDGINMRTFDEQLEENLQMLAQEMRSEAFEPRPVRRVYIPKPNGKVRPLGIPAIKDRIVQEALRMVLEPIFEADFSPFSYGFRPTRCTMDAISHAYWYVQEHLKYFWVIEGDISSFFDTIHHPKLLRLLGRRIKDKKILRLTWKFLRAGVMEKRTFRDTKLGTPQGGIISPLLANIYLHELDKYMERFTGLSAIRKTWRRRQNKGNYAYIRYADDFIVLCNGHKREAEVLREELHTFLYQELKLTLSKEKTKITHLNDGFEFLGFRLHRAKSAHGPGIKRTRILIPQEAIVKFQNKLKLALAPASHQDSMSTKIQALNRIIAGWCQYYQYTSKASTQFNELHDFVFWLMAHWLGRKFKRNMPDIMERFKDGNTFAAHGRRLTMPSDFQTCRYKKYPSNRLPNPYLTQERPLTRETLPDQTHWTGKEPRPGMADLRPIILLDFGHFE